MLRFSDHRVHLERLVRAALDSGDPAAAVARHWPDELNHARRVRVLGVGKASGAMTDAAVERLGGRVTRGLAVHVPGRPGGSDRVEWLRGDHPVPTERNVFAAKRVASFVGECDADEMLLVLLSGGGSAHLAWAAEGLTLDDLRETTELLLRAGTPIEELNAVRKHCERLKGGRLAELATPARVIVLVLSDVMGDRLDTISSGPFAPDRTRYAAAVDTLERCGLGDGAVAEHLRRGVAGKIEETPKSGHPCFANVTHTVVGSNRFAVEAVAEEARVIGFHVAEVEHGVEGAAADVGWRLAACLRADTSGRAVCWVLGGETTVDAADAPGTGGRNQELALSAAVGLVGVPDAAVLALATDGVDGTTPAAGAIVTSHTVSELREREIDAERALREHDSFTALDAVGATLRTGPTGTNVNDVAVGVRYGE